MESIVKIFGEGENLSTLQMSLRAAAIFIVTLLLLRIAGRRSFGMKSPFDNIIVILLGAILSRTVVGASEFVPTISAALVIAVLHRLFAWIGSFNLKFGRVIKGRKIALYQNGHIMKENLKRALVSETDLYASLRNHLQEDNFENIESAFMESDGQISFVRKNTNITSEKAGIL
ncbi:DUF421 domain-containing protein [Dyadobacter flavalbus]|uniref:DUF421 domain-containing protein n=1 Tax=Dyadobacter flavalbus TaxID=2579942 RepID=A0A5M8QGH7_9BACT|nr:YetF domain-containing protein [Dyadobacter flavalbus]KAA6434074.1 DUF421 domain-containing protein [Dyadobacter flavalbus]